MLVRPQINLPETTLIQAGEIMDHPGVSGSVTTYEPEDVEVMVMWAKNARALEIIRAAKPLGERPAITHYAHLEFGSGNEVTDFRGVSSETTLTGLRKVFQRFRSSERNQALSKDTVVTLVGAAHESTQEDHPVIQSADDTEQ